VFRVGALYSVHRVSVLGFIGPVHCVGISLQCRLQKSPTSSTKEPRFIAKEPRFIAKEPSNSFLLRREEARHEMGRSILYLLQKSPTSSAKEPCIFRKRAQSHLKRAQQ